MDFIVRGWTALTGGKFRSKHDLESKKASKEESGYFQGLTWADQVTAEAVGSLDFRHRSSLFPGDG